MQEQKSNKDKSFRYFINNKEINNRTDYLNATMSGEYITFLEDDSVFSFPISDFLCGERHQSNREINEHLKDVLNKSVDELTPKNFNKETGAFTYKSFGKPFTFDQTKDPVETFITDILELGQIQPSGLRNHYNSKTKNCNYTMCQERECTHCYPKGSSTRHKAREKDKFHAEKENKTMEFLDEVLERTEEKPHIYSCCKSKQNCYCGKFSAQKTEKEENLVFPKDSEIHKEAYKETKGKLFYELDWKFITQMAERMASNKKENKYELFNWKNPMTPKGIEDLKQATMRHLLEIMNGNYEDDGREFGHIEAVSDNMMMLNYQLKNNS